MCLTGVSSAMFASFLPRPHTHFLCLKRAESAKTEKHRDALVAMAERLETPGLYYVNMIGGWEELGTLDRDTLTAMSEEPVEVNILIDAARFPEEAIHFLDTQISDATHLPGNTASKLTELRTVLLTAWDDTDQIFATIERLDPKVSRAEGPAEWVLCLTLEMLRRATRASPLHGVGDALARSAALTSGTSRRRP